MKTLRLIPVLGLVLAFVFGCQKEKEKDDASFLVGKKTAGETLVHESGECGAYVVTLESKTFVNGKWEWIWSIENSNPDIADDLAYWGMQFGDCFCIGDICSAAFSTTPGNWESFTPAYAVDAGLKCTTSKVLKFPKGTTGTAKTYYKLILTKDYAVNPNANGYSKSVCGCCCHLTFCGVGCLPPVGWCSLTQGYWFARPKTTWCQGVVFGANTYSQAQGKNIWDNAPANSAVKHAFTQASTLQLNSFCRNQGAAIPADILSAYNTCVSFLAGLTYNDILTGEYPADDYKELNAAAGAIGEWVNTNHCDEN